MIPVVSILMPNLNMRRFLPERMESILAQTHQNWELVVCDSYSDDGSWEYLQSFTSDPRIRLFQVPRDGLYAGWNECLKRAQGRFVYIATSDDTAHPKLITELLRLLEENPSASIARCGCQKIDSDSRAIVGNELLYDRFISRLGNGPFLLPGSTEIILMGAFGQTWGSFTQLLFRQEVFDRTGLFPTQFGISGDWAWSLRAAFTSEVVHVTEKLATWRIHSSQASAKWNLDGHTVYHTLFCDFIRDHIQSAMELWGWDKSAKVRLLESAWQRYEENSGWFLYQLISNPRHFFSKGLQVWRSNRNLFWRRLRHGCLVPNCATGDRLQAAERLLNHFNCN